MARAGVVLQFILCIRIKGDNVGKITLVVDVGGRRKQNKDIFGIR